LPVRKGDDVFLRGLRVQAQVVYALILRETRTRFGRNAGGYLWAILEPLLMIGVLAGLMSAGLRHSVPPGMTVLSFLATGLLPYQFFSGIHSRMSAAVRSNQALLYYPRIMPLDLLWARLILEFSTLFVVFLIVMGCDAMYFERVTLDNVMQLLLGLFLAAGIGVGVGLVFGSLGMVYPVVDRVRGALFRPLFLISGVWFTANELPPEYRRLLMYNPIIHCTELVRGGWFRSYEPRYAEPLYALAWVVVLVAVGLTLERVARRFDAEGAS
jgi:capsular polysaccharide transport system permease protein